MTEQQTKTIELQKQSREIAEKWVKRLGFGFHPDTRGADYSPALPSREIAEYDADMERLFAIECDPYAVACAAMETAARAAIAKATQS